jgi:hypothetical protein
MSTPISAVPRNAACACGSGKKSKKCCGAQPEQASVSPAQEWHNLDNQMVEDMSNFGRRRFGDEWAHVLADYPVDSRAMEAEPAHMNLFIQWLCHERKFEGRPASHHYLEARGRNLSASEKTWLESQQQAWLSVWEVIDFQEGGWIELVDLITRERRRVVELTASRGLRRRLAFLARVVDHAGMAMLCGLHPNPLSAGSAHHVLEDMREALGPSKHITGAQLRRGDIPTLLIESWQRALEAVARQPLPDLTTTDGERVVLVKDIFALVGSGARAEMSRRLTAEPDILIGGQSRADVFLVSKEHRKHAAAGAPATILGRISLTTRELRIETDSRERAARLRDRLERLADGRLRHKRRNETDPIEAMAGAGHPVGPAPRGGRLPDDPVANELALSFKRQHYADWVDHPLPALDGLSPREATLNPALRARLSLLLKEMEELEECGPERQRYSFEEVRRELGMLAT